MSSGSWRGRWRRGRRGAAAVSGWLLLLHFITTCTKVLLSYCCSGSPAAVGRSVGWTRRRAAEKATECVSTSTAPLRRPPAAPAGGLVARGLARQRRRPIYVHGMGVAVELSLSPSTSGRLLNLPPHCGDRGRPRPLFVRTTDRPVVDVDYKWRLLAVCGREQSAFPSLSRFSLSRQADDDDDLFLPSLSGRSCTHCNNGRDFVVA